MKFSEIVEKIEKIAPPELGAAWDNSGVQIQAGTEDVKTVLVALEMNREVLKEARQEHAELIVTHHPLLFGGVKSIDAADGHIGTYIAEALRHHISIYGAHIPFDNAPKGNNFYLAELLGLENVQTPPINPEEFPGVVGEFETEKTLEEVCLLTEKVLHLPKNYLRVVGAASQPIKKVAICTGAGGDMLSVALANDCRLLLTGEIKFHEAQEAAAKGLVMIDAGHYGTEQIFTENFAEQLQQLVGEEVTVKKAVANTNPYMV